MKETHMAVFFTRNNTRIFPFKEMGDLPRTKNVLVNPDMSAVDGVAPHHWKIVDGRIAPMNEEEKKIRDQDIANQGAQNNIEDSTPPFVPRFNLIEPKILKALNNILICLLINMVFTVGTLLKLFLIYPSR